MSHYIPILKNKEGEYTAFPVLDHTLRNTVSPLFEVLPFPAEDAVDECETVIEKLTKNLVNWPKVFVDLGLVDPTIRAGRAHPITAVFHGLRVNGISAVPVIGLRADFDYADAVRDVVAVDARGACLRLKAGDLAARLNADVTAILRHIGCLKSQIDLVIDFSSIPEDGGTVTGMAMEAYLTRIPNLNAWRTVTVAASSFPETLSAVSRDSERYFFRAEWLAWNYLRSANVGRVPDFGDYAIASPVVPTGFLPGIMTTSPNIRYTTDDNWLCLKARSVKSSPLGGKQSHALCRNLIAHTEYKGAAFSWGDDYIEKCSRNAVGPGNASTWRKVGTNHHIALVVNQLSNLP